MALGTTIGNTTYYLGADLSCSTTPTYWTREGQKLKNGNNYLRIGNNAKLSTTTNSGSASNFSIDYRGYLYTTISSLFWDDTYYITLSTSGQASLSTSSNNAAKRLQSKAQLESNELPSSISSDSAQR